MSQGGLIGLAEVVKGLQVLSELRHCPPRSELYDNARHPGGRAGGEPDPAEVDAEDSVDVVLFRRAASG